MKQLQLFNIENIELNDKQNDEKIKLIEKYHSIDSEWSISAEEKQSEI